MALISYDFDTDDADGVKAKRILYVEGNVDGTVGGSYYVLHDLVTNLNKYKYQPVVVFYFDHFLIEKFKEQGIETYLLCRPEAFILPYQPNSHFICKYTYKLLYPIQRLINLFKRLIIPAFQFSKFIKQKRIDLINLNNSVTRNHEWMLASLITGISCMTHEMGINNNFSLTSKFFASRMKSIICVSHTVESNMRNRGLDLQHIQTIHNGIDLKRYHIERTAAQVRSDFELSDDQFVIGVIGNIKTWKGQETVIRATKLLTDDFPDIRCLLVGGIADGDRYYYDQLRKLSVELDIVDNVIFTGFQENAIDFMNIMDIIIHSSIDPEPFGIVNLEAMFLKKPIISTRIGAPVEIFEDGESGILVMPGDPKELSKACIDILSNHNKSQKLGDAAHKRLMNKFTIETNIRQTEAVYSRLLY